MQSWHKERAVGVYVTHTRENMEVSELDIVLGLGKQVRLKHADKNVAFQDSVATN